MTRLSHWTNRGTFLIEDETAAGSVICRLWFEKDGKRINLGPYFYVFTASESVGKGEHDKALGFAASALGVPGDFRLWNGR